MADYVVVLKNAVESLADNSPETRAVMYDKARTALRRQLEALENAMSPQQAEAQLQALDAAVAEVEAEYAPPPSPEDLLQSGLEDALGEIESDPVHVPEPPEATPESLTEPEPEPEPEAADAGEEDAKDEAEDATDDDAPAPEPDTIEVSQSEKSAIFTDSDEDDDDSVILTSGVGAGAEAGAPEKVEEQPTEETPAEDAPQPADEPEAEPTAEAVEAAPAEEAVDDVAESEADATPEDDAEPAADDTGNETRERLIAAFEGTSEVEAPQEPEPDDEPEDEPAEEPEPELTPGPDPEASPLDRVQTAVQELEALTTRKEPKLSEVIPFTPKTNAGSAPEPEAPPLSSASAAPEPHAPDLQAENDIAAPEPRLSASNDARPSLDSIRVEPIEIPTNRESSMAWVIWLGVALVVAAAGTWGYMNRETVMPMLQSLTDKAREFDERTPPAETPKIDDRVPDANAPVEEEPAPEPEPAPADETPPVDSGDAVDTPDATPTQTVEAQPADEGTPSAAANAQAGLPLGSEAAILYEEGAGDTGGDLAHNGAIAWSVVREPTSSGEQETVLQGISTVPTNGITYSMYIRKNTDATLPASHTVEVLFTVPADYKFGAIKNIGGILLKPAEPQRGETLIGAAAPVTEGYFIVGLSNEDQDKAKNLELLKNRDWFDIPLLFDSGKRGILTLAKGETGKAAFAEAFTAWGE